MNSYRNVNEDEDKSRKYKRIIKKEQCQLGMIDNVAHDMKKNRKHSHRMLLGFRVIRLVKCKTT